MDEWDDKETGKKRSKIKVRADRVVFITFKDGTKEVGDNEQPKEESRPVAKPPALVRDAPFEDDTPF